MNEEINDDVNAEVDETHHGEAEEGDMDWEENNTEDDRLDLDWVEEEDGDYCEDENSLLEAGENLENDDLLGQEFDDLERNKAQKVDEKKKKRHSPVSDVGLGLSKQKGKKKDKSKKALLPKAQSGQSTAQGAASKKLFNLHGRFSPKTHNNIPIGPKTSQRQPRRSANGIGGDVLPTSLKTKESKSLTDMGGPSKPP